MFGIIAFILCFQFIPVFLGMAESGKEMAALAAVMAAVIFTIFIIASVLGKKYNNNQIEAKIAREDNSRKRQVMIAQERGRQAEQKLERVSAKKAKLEKSQEDIFKELNEAKKILSNIYAENVLPAKYRSFNAVATLYEYLETGRCNTIQGHGGIYDTYEYDLRLGVIIRNLVEINSRLADIQENQRRLYNEFRQANQTLSQISTTLKNIEDINVDIARNSAISAAANQQTAAASNYMAWHIWHNS